MNVLITGTTQGIGRAIAVKFLDEGHTVHGIDRQEGSIDHPAYTHYVCDVRDYEHLPALEDVEILVNNAGTQNEEDIDINLKALIHMTETYGIQPGIKSILHIGSASAHTGAEFPLYCASKGGILAYTKNVAMRIAPYGATCNSLDPGGVLTPLKKWATPEEMADWAYFLTVVNTFCTGQNILVDGGESINYHFVWKD